MKQARRRSAQQWGRLVREWERSGQTAERFSARRGLRPSTLVWWRWRLRQAAAGARTPTGKGVELVPVRVVAESGGDPAAAEGSPAWELEAPSGHVLRVYEPTGVDVLREALAVVARGRRRP